MMRFCGLFGVVLAATAIAAVPAIAAVQHERIRGTIEAVNRDSLIVQTQQGGEARLVLTDATRYVSVVKSKLSKVAPGSFIGTATKGSGDFLVALEVVIFPHLRCAVRAKATTTGTRCRIQRWPAAAWCRAA